MGGRRIALLLVLGTCLAACGGGVDAEQVTLRVMLADDWVDTRPVIDAVLDFEADHPGITVSLVGRPFSQIEDELAAAVAAGRPLDVVQGHAFAAGARDLAEPLDDDVLARDYFPGAVADVRWGSTTYGVPLDINAMFLVLDPAAVTAGPPETFADVREIAEAATDQGRRGMFLSSSAWLAYGWIRANGGEIVEVDDAGRPTFTLDRLENVEALQFLADLVGDGLAYGPTTRNVSADAFGLFAQGETAILTTGTWDTTSLATDHPGRAFVTAPLPGGMDGTTVGSALGGSSLMVGRGSPHVEEALALIDALTDPDVALALAEQEGRLPPTESLLDRAGLPADVLDTLRTQLASAHPQMLIAFPHAQEAFAQAIDDVLTGRRDAAEALALAQRVAVRDAGG